MSLKHILLGMLDQPRSGYDLRKRFDSSLTHFWAAELSQIYPTLGRMEEQGLLTSRMQHSDKGPPRKLYRRTPKGTRALQRWLEQGPRVNEERRHYLAQAFFLHAAGDPDVARKFMRDLHDVMKRKLEALKEGERNWRECDARYPDALPDDGFYAQLTLELGLKIFAAHVDWCEHCLQRMDQRRAARSRSSRHAKSQSENAAGSR